MKLQAKIGVALLCSFLLLLGAAYATLQVAVTPKFERLEAETHARAIARIRANVESVKDDMRSRALDYAHWDEMYAYMRRQNRAFVAEYFGPDWFENYETDLIVLMDNDGRILWRGARTGQPLPSNALIQSFLRDWRAARGTGRQASAAGIVWGPEGPLTFAAARVLRSDGQGQMRGIVLMGRKLDVGALQARTQQQLAFAPADSLPDDQRERLASDGYAAWVEPDALRAHIALPGASGSIVGAINSSLPRDIASLGTDATRMGMMLAGIALLVALGAMWALINYLVTSRIAALEAHIASQSEDLQPMRDPRGADEIASLTRAYNALHVRMRDARTREKQATIEREAEARASQLKSAFIATLSHELRTPLNAIIGYTELLEEDLPTAAEDLHRIRYSAGHLLTLINEILDLSRIEAGRLEVSPHAFDAAAMARELEAELRPLASARGNVLSLTLATEPMPVFTDAVRLRQALTNVLSNACKFTEGGRVNLFAQCIRDADGPELRFEISDTGIGMSPDQLERIFEPFVQADDTVSRRFGGTGLGLALSRKLLGLLGGAITARSAPGEGSTFTISVPAELRQQAEPKPAAAA